MKDETDVNRVIEQYSDLVRRICFVHLKNREDTEDVFQTVFMKYLLHSGSFQNAEHEKAWFIRVTVNACKDLLRFFVRHQTVPLDEICEEGMQLSSESRELFDEILALPEKYRDVIYLYYYEEYSAVEIAGLLDKRVNTIYTWLARAKELLRNRLGGDCI